MPEQTTPISKVDFTPPEHPQGFSSKTVDVSKLLGEKISSNNPIHADDIAPVVDAMSDDLEKMNVNIHQQERDVWKKTATTTIEDTQGKISKEQQVPKNEIVDFKTYKKISDEIFNRYGVNHHLGRLSVIEGMKVAQSTLLASSSLLMTNVEGMKKIMGSMKNVVTGTGDQEPPKLFGTKQMLGVGLVLPAALLETYSKDAFRPIVVDAQKRLNERISQSIFMRDFEFVHDKSGAEILNIIEKGKHGVTQLLESNYLSILPNLATLGAGNIVQMFRSIPAGVLGLLKIYPMWQSGKQRVAETLAARKSDSLQKDMIDTRILTLLQGLDIAKTSGNMDQATTELLQAMDMKDKMQEKGIKSEFKRERKTKLVEWAASAGIPLVAAGTKLWQMWRHIPVQMDGEKPVEGIMQFVAKGFSPEGKAALQQAGSDYIATTLIQNFVAVAGSNLVSEYANKIQPVLQDIQRMEELLGPYDAVDTPNGAKEQARIGADTLPNFDIHIDQLNFKNILHDVSLDIPQGSFVTIKGLSGLGKTTFMQHAVGLYGASENVVTYGGVDLQGIKKFGDQSIYAKVAYANQEPQYFEDLTLKDNLLLWSKKDIPDEHITKVMHDLRLDHLRERLDGKIKHFSGGEKRRIGIARALLKDPKVLFLDEPTANLDEESSRQVLEIIKDMRKTRPDMTVVAVTHDANFEKIAEQIVDFRDVNQPSDIDSVLLGDRQVFYANSKTNTVQ